MHAANEGAIIAGFAIMEDKCNEFEKGYSNSESVMRQGPWSATGKRYSDKSQSWTQFILWMFTKIQNEYQNYGPLGDNAKISCGVPG
jgi:hypothetical protein